MNVTVREARRADCVRLMELVRELAEFERAPQDVTISYEHFVESGFGSNPIWRAFVAETEGIIVGFALYYVRFSTWKGQTMYLEDIIVSETYRNKGIGRLLFDALINEAEKKQFYAINWQVLEWNTQAIDFYKKYNPSFDAAWINCRMPLNVEVSS